MDLALALLRRLCPSAASSGISGLARLHRGHLECWPRGRGFTTGLGGTGGCCGARCFATTTGGGVATGPAPHLRLARPLADGGDWARRRGAFMVPTTIGTAMAAIPATASDTFFAKFSRNVMRLVMIASILFFKSEPVTPGHARQRRFYVQLADIEDRLGVNLRLIAEASTPSSQARSRSSTSLAPIHHTRGWNQNIASTIM